MRTIACLTGFSICLSAQEPLSFEVASVRMRQPGGLISMIGGAPSGSRLTLEAMRIYDLISWAYDVKPWQVDGGPACAGIQKDRTSLDEATRRFDITAKAEGDNPLSTDEFRQMLQDLLLHRFRLAFHRETRDSPLYALVLDKNGPKFRESSPESNGVLRMNGRGKIVATGGTISELVNWFSNANGVDRPVIDQTGLAGRYDFTLSWSNPLLDAKDATEPSIFTAMREQIGLRLQASQAPLVFLVIDPVEMPGEN